MKTQVIENFFSQEDFDELCKLELNKTGPQEVKVYHNAINGDNVIQNDCINKNLLKKLNKNYHEKAMSILIELNKEKAELYDYSEFHIIETGLNCKFPIHDDTPNKLLSGVIYLKPEKNLGTFFYNNKQGEGEREIEWKTNKGVFFSRTERQSWHSYKADNKSNRVVVVYNLMTKRIKEVYKIEKKNYIMGIFRFKLNPYFHKYLGFTL